MKINSWIREIGIVLITMVHLGVHSPAVAAEPVEYEIKPGDILIVNIWKEKDLTMEVLVRPDGKFSFPLAGDVQAAHRSVEQVRQDVIAKIGSFIPDVVATVMVKSIDGNRAFVVGKVLKPGPILMTDRTNVMQALSMAGGTAQFAELKHILILRGQGSSQSAVQFNYGEVESGQNLEQNIVLEPGDVVVVP